MEEISEIMGVKPIMIDAALVSAQRRKRLFWTNIPKVRHPEDRGIMLNDILEDATTDREKSYCIDANYFKGGNLKSYAKGKRQLVTPNRSEVFQYRRSYWRKTKGGKVPTLTANMGTGGNNVPYVRVKEATKKGYVDIKLGECVDLTQINSKTRRGRKMKEKSNCLTTQDLQYYKLTEGGLRKLTPVECERLQSLPDGYTEGVSDTRRYHALGNAFNADVVAHIISHAR